MKITALVENTTANKELTAMHGLSLFIETSKHKILVDTGSGDLFFRNAQKLGVDIAEVDIAIITHGHSDHGGGLECFLEHNKTAKVYISESAFLPHYVRIAGFIKKYIGLDVQYKNHPQVIKTTGDLKINEQVTLICSPLGKNFMPKFNVTLLEKKGRKTVKDAFDHEQSVIISEDKNVLIGGCAHRGIVNIIQDAKEKTNGNIEVCISGFHLFNPASQKTEDADRIEKIAGELIKNNIEYYTCHCTGTKAYEILKSKMNEKINYLSTGQSIEL